VPPPLPTSVASISTARRIARTEARYMGWSACGTSTTTSASDSYSVELQYFLDRYRCITWLQVVLYVAISCLSLFAVSLFLFCRSPMTVVCTNHAVRLYVHSSVAVSHLCVTSIISRTRCCGNVSKVCVCCATACLGDPAPTRVDIGILSFSCILLLSVRATLCGQSYSARG